MLFLLLWCRMRCYRCVNCLHFISIKATASICNDRNAINLLWQLICFFYFRWKRNSENCGRVENRWIGSGLSVVLSYETLSARVQLHPRQRASSVGRAQWFCSFFCAVSSVLLCHSLAIFNLFFDARNTFLFLLLFLLISSSNFPFQNKKLIIFGRRWYE